MFLQRDPFLDGKCIIGYLKKRDMEFYGVDGKDLDGIVSQLRLTAGVEVAMLSMKWKLSLSKFPCVPTEMWM